MTPPCLTFSFHEKARHQGQDSRRSEIGTSGNTNPALAPSSIVAIDAGNHKDSAPIDAGIAILPAFPEFLLDAPLRMSPASLLSPWKTALSSSTTFTYHAIKTGIRKRSNRAAAVGRGQRIRYVPAE
jgi:hypothetical protein